MFHIQRVVVEVDDVVEFSISPLLFILHLFIDVVAAAADMVLYSTVVDVNFSHLHSCERDEYTLRE